MKIISLVNSKGGVGKSTLCINLARYVQLYHCKNVENDKDKKVLIIDTDQQGTLRDWHDAGGSEYLELLIADKKSTVRQLPDILKKTNYDYVFIDTPGTMNEIIGSAICVSDMVLVPLQPSPFDVWSTQDVVELIKTRHSVVGDQMPRTNFIVNGCVKGTKAEKDVINYLNKGTIVPLYQCIYQRIAYAEAASRGHTIFESDNKIAINETFILGSQMMEKLNDLR